MKHDILGKNRISNNIGLYNLLGHLRPFEVIEAT